MRIIFVCLGNIVRSPLAEHLFKKKINEMNLDNRYEIESAGTSAWHIGESPDHRMRAVAKNHGLVYDGKARQFSKHDFERLDLILAMDKTNEQNLLNLANSPMDKAKVHLLRKYDSQKSNSLSVPDPYYGGVEGFERVFRIVNRACDGLLNYLENIDDTN